MPELRGLFMEFKKHADRKVCFSCQNVQRQHLPTHNARQLHRQTLPTSSARRSSKHHPNTIAYV